MFAQPKNNVSHWLDAIEDPWYILILQIQETIFEETTNFYKKRNIHNILLPITTGSISSPMGLGSDSKPVKVSIGGKETYLADSMQFLLEYGCRFFDNGCYYIMPSFRGEDVDKRHLSQFFHSEAEIHGDLDNVMNLVDEYVKYLLVKILKKHGKNIKRVTGTVGHIRKAIDDKFIRTTFDEAERILRQKYTTEIDKYIEINDLYRNITHLGEKALMEHFDGIVWVKNYDIASVPFYQKADPANNKLAKNADLLMGIGELIGCGERNVTSEELLLQIKAHKIDKANYKWYIKMREKYPIKTSGFGMGIERLLLFILKHDDIRDVQVILRFNEGDDTV